MDDIARDLIDGMDDHGFCTTLIPMMQNASGSGLALLYEDWVLARLRLIRQRAVPIFHGTFLTTLRGTFGNQIYVPDLILAMNTPTMDKAAQAEDGDVPPEVWAAEIEDVFRHGLPQGVHPGWETLKPHYRPLKGDISVITGNPSSYKSGVMHALAINLAKQHGWNFSAFNPEHHPLGSLGGWLVESYMGRRMHQLDPDEHAFAKEWVTDHFHQIRPTEGMAATLPWLLDVARVQKQRYGLDGLILDPWNYIHHAFDIREKETDYIGRCLTDLKEFAVYQDIHLWVIAHPAKPQESRAKDGPYKGKFPPRLPHEIHGCYAADTEVLTDNGWKTHQTMTGEDRVACFDLKQHSLSYQHPLQQWEYDWDGPMINFRSPSFDALVTPNHRMVVSQIWRNRRPMKGTGHGRGRPIKYADGWGFVEAQHVGTQLVMPWASGLEDTAEDIDTIQGFDADNLLRFLGWWISEGNVSSHGLHICQAVGPLQRYMEDTLRRLGMFFKSGITQYRPDEQPMWTARLYKRMHPTLTQWVSAECGNGAENKHLPAMVWGLSLRQKQVLLDALIDGDGHLPPARPDTAKYATTSPRLADEIQRLAIEIGYPAILASQPGALPHHLRRYEVHIGRPQRRRIALRSERHRRIEQYAGKVYCLTVPTGAYVTRRNGKMLIAGNSAHWWNKMDFCLSSYRQEDENGQLTNIVELHVQKNRRYDQCGWPGTAVLRYDGRRFYDVGNMTVPTPEPQAEHWAERYE